MKRAQGIDISHYQGIYTPQHHHDFVILKATEGNRWVDFKFDRNCSICNDAEIITGAYHYFRSSFDWKSQVDNFLDATDGKLINFYALDFEKINNKKRNSFAENASLFVNQIWAETQKPILFYSSPSIIQEWMFGVNSYWIRDYEHLWVAQWPYYGWNDVMLSATSLDIWQPRLPAGCPNWKFWQYSADGNQKGKENGVESDSVDLNVFNGSVEDLRLWARLSEPEQPKPKISVLEDSNYKITIEAK